MKDCIDGGNENSLSLKISNWTVECFQINRGARQPRYRRPLTRSGFVCTPV